MRFEAITWERLADELAAHADALKPADGGPWLRIAVDGAPAARTGELAGAVAEGLRLRGRAVLPVSTAGFLRLYQSAVRVRQAGPRLLLRQLVRHRRAVA